MPSGVEYLIFTSYTVPALPVKFPLASRLFFTLRGATAIGYASLATRTGTLFRLYQSQIAFFTKQAAVAILDKFDFSGVH